MKQVYTVYIGTRMCYHGIRAEDAMSIISAASKDDGANVQVIIAPWLETDKEQAELRFKQLCQNAKPATNH